MLRSISSDFQDGLLSWWTEHLARQSATPLPPAIYGVGSASWLLRLSNDSLHAIVLRLLDGRGYGRGPSRTITTVLVHRRVLRDVVALMSTCVTMRESLDAFGPFGAIRLEAMARLALAKRWHTDRNAYTTAIRFQEHTLRHLPLYALAWYFDESVEEGSAAMLERLTDERTMHCASSKCCGGAHRRMAKDCDRGVASLEGMGSAPFASGTSFTTYSQGTSILVGGGAHSSVIAVLSGCVHSPRADRPSRRLSVMGCEAFREAWHVVLDVEEDEEDENVPSGIPYDISAVTVEGSGRAVAIVASDIDAEKRNVQYSVWVWTWRPDGPPVRRVFHPPSALLAEGVSSAHMHAQDAWFGTSDANALHLVVASSPTHMKLRGDFVVNDDALTSRIRHNLAVDDGLGGFANPHDLRTHVDAPGVVSLRIDASTGELKHAWTEAMEDSTGAVPIDAAHDERGDIAALILRVTYATSGNVGDLCTHLISQRVKDSLLSGEDAEVQEDGTIVGPRFVKLIDTRHTPGRPRHLLTHVPYQARRWKEFVQSGPVSVALSPDGRILALGFVRKAGGEMQVSLDVLDSNGIATQWRMVTDSYRHAASRRLLRSTVAATPLVEFSPTGRYIVVRDAAPQIGERGWVIEVVDLGTYGESATIVLHPPRCQSFVRWLLWTSEGVWVAPGAGLLHCGRTVLREALVEATNVHGAIAL